MLQIHAPNNGMLLRLVTERDISVSNKMRIVLPIGRRHSAHVDAQIHAHVPGIVSKPEKIYTRRNSQSSAITHTPHHMVVVVVMVMVGFPRAHENTN